MKNKTRSKKFNPYNVKLDAEEQKLLKSFERGEWKSVDNLPREMKRAKRIAANTLLKIDG
jgi:hypothetical protein